jgi:HAMP domain
MNLRTLFALPIAVILLVTLSLAGMMAAQGWSGQERGRAAAEAVERMRLLLQVQGNLRLERIMSNMALGKEYPLPLPIARRLTDARRDTDRAIGAAAAEPRGGSADEAGAKRSEAYIPAVRLRLQSVRSGIDALLDRHQNERSFPELNTVMPRGLEVAAALDAPVERARLAVVAADPGLAGLLTEDRLAASLRDEVALIAAVLVPRFGKAQSATAADLDQVQILLGRATFLIALLDESIEIAGATIRIRIALTSVKAINVGEIFRRLSELRNAAPDDAQDDALPPMSQRILVPWGERISALRAAMVDTMVERVSAARAAGETRFNLVMVAFGMVVVAILECVALLSHRIVVPIAQLGLAIDRIAAGDRGVPLTLRSGTREINDMVKAVETLRQAALVADAAALRQRMVARRRLELLREALEIAQTVREPARALERGVASLSKGIEATIALLGATAALPPTLGTAADAIRFGLAEMRGFAAGLDATFAAASEAQTEDRTPAEFVAHIRAMEVEVARRDVAVRGFVQSSLVALRDAASSAGSDNTPALRDLVGDQFEHIEATVATMASMRDAVTRAGAIVRGLPLDDAPIAA